MRFLRTLLEVEFGDDDEFMGFTTSRMKLPVFADSFMIRERDMDRTLVIYDGVVLDFSEKKKLIKQIRDRPIWVRVTGAMEVHNPDGFCEIDSDTVRRGSIAMEWRLTLYAEVLEILSQTQIQETTAPPDNDDGDDDQEPDEPPPLSPVLGADRD